MKILAFYSTEISSDVYHDESTCTEGNNIESYYRRFGTAGRPKCAHCRRISG